MLQKHGGACYFYLLLLSALDPVLIVITAVTTLAGYFAGKRINGWGWRHREEEAQYIHKLKLCGRKGGRPRAGQGMYAFSACAAGWRRSTKKYTGYIRTLSVAVSGFICGADVVDVLMTLLRNGAAYAYCWALR